jgi:hypothetical protein
MKKISYTDAELTLAAKKDNAIRDGLNKMATGFIAASRGIYAICLKEDGKHLYRALKNSKGDFIKTQEEYADHLGMSLSDLKSLDRVGRMLSMAESANGWIMEVSEAELLACGKASLVELCRLAKNEAAFDANMGHLIALINARASGKITHAVLKDKIDAILKPGKNDADAPEEPGKNDADAPEEPESNEPEWRREFKARLGTCATPADALEVAQAILKEYGTAGNVLTMTAVA